MDGRRKDGAAAALLAAWMASGCAPGLLDALSRTADDPEVAAPRAVSLKTENRIDVSWDADPGADAYVLERAADAAGPVYVEVYRGGGTSYADLALEDQGLYLYRLTKTRGARAFGPSDPVLGVYSSVRGDEHEPNDTEAAATELAHDRLSNLYFYRSRTGLTVQDEDWYSVFVPARRKALIVLSYDAADDQTYLYFYEAGRTPEPVVNGQAIEIYNAEYAARTFRFKIYALGDAFVADPTLSGGRLLDYSVSLYQIVSP